MNKYLSLISKKTKLKCAAITFMALAGSILASVWPVKLGSLYTEIGAGNISTLAGCAAAIAVFGLIYLSAECITILRRVLLDCVIASHEAEIRKRSIEKLLKMPVAYYSGSLSGERTAQLNQGVFGLSQLIKILCSDVAATVLTAICTLIQVFLNASLLMTGIMVMYLFTTLIISFFQIRSQNGIREDIIRQKNGLDGKICQSISNLELIRGMNAETYETKRLEPGILSISATEKRHHKYMGTFDCLKQVCKITFQVLVLVLSVVLIASEKMPAGAAITVCLLFQQLIKPIDEVYRFMDETASSVVKAKTLLEVTNGQEDEVFSISEYTISESEKPQSLSSGTESENSVKDAVIFSNVMITNPQKDKNLAFYDNLTIPAGRITAICGASGCGKTTMARCLNRYYPYTAGNVKLFGRDLSDYSQRELAETIYYVPQSTFFFAGTVRENLVYGLNRIFSDSELIVALSEACIYDELRKNADSDDDVLQLCVSEGGTNFSGGQRQRLSLARAFLRTPKLYIFDESTANLDEKTASTVLNNLKKHASRHGAGAICISHDENVVHMCDESITLVNKLNLTQFASHDATDTDGEAA